MALFGSLFASPPVSVLTFAGIQWGETLTAAQKKLEAAGYAIDADDQGDIAFHGPFAGLPATGWAWLTQEKHPVVQKVSLTITPEEAELFIAYDRVRRALIQKLGPTPHTVEIFEAPYSNGDGRVIEALRENKAIIGTFWREHEENINIGCVMRIQATLAIKVAFEGPGWQAELVRRQQLGMT